MPEHSEMRGIELHWPRGADTAVSGQVPVALGDGTVQWQSLQDAIYAAAPRVSYKSFDTVINNDDTLVADDSIESLEFVGYGIYKVEGQIHVDSADGTTGFQVAFSVASGTLWDSLLHYTVLKPDTGTIATSGPTAAETAASFSTPGGTGVLTVLISGYMEMEDATISLMIAQDTAAATDTTFHQGSVISFTPQLV